MNTLNKSSRTKNTMYNLISILFGQVINLILQFVVRTVFINTLGKSYLGINGLFSNILTMLSLADLGVGSAILFKLYEPLAKNDEQRINILIKFYKKVYTFIGIIVLLVGLTLIPFLKYIIKDYTTINEIGVNLTFVYILYLIKTVSSYLFFAYKSAIIKADQKEYKLNIIIYVVNFITSIVQIITLVTLKNFELYVIIFIISVVLENYLSAKLAEKLYPIIKEKCFGKLDKKEILNIFKDCGAIFINKINVVVLTATDNIIISMFLGIDMVGLYSNYYVLYSTINTIFNKVFDSVTHSLGNLHVTKDIEKEYRIYKTINLITILLGATTGITFFCVADKFIKLWVGDAWIIPQPFSLLMGIEIFTMSMDLFIGKYRTSMGLFQQSKYRPLFGMVINIVVSAILVNIIGLNGVLIGTIAANWLTLIWYDPLIIHKYGFLNKYSVKKYYLKNMIYVGVTTILGILCYFVTQNVFDGHGWFTLIFDVVLCVALISSIIIILFLKSDEGKEIIKLKNKIIKK